MRSRLALATFSGHHMMTAVPPHTSPPDGTAMQGRSRVSYGAVGMNCLESAAPETSERPENQRTTPVSRHSKAEGNTDELGCRLEFGAFGRDQEVADRIGCGAATPPDPDPCSSGACSTPPPKPHRACAAGMTVLSPRSRGSPNTARTPARAPIRSAGPAISESTGPSSAGLASKFPSLGTFAGHSSTVLALNAACGCATNG